MISEQYDYKNFIYVRDYNKDVPYLVEKSHYAKRVALAAIPFLSLHPALRKPISIAMGCVRIWNTNTHVLDVIISVSAVAGSCFNHRYGIVATVLHDLTKVINEVRSSKDWESALKALTKGFNQVAYLTLLSLGCVELAILATASESIVSLMQSKDEFNRDRWIEGMGHLGMALTRLYQYYNLYPPPPIIQKPLPRIDLWMPLEEILPLEESQISILADTLEDMEEDWMFDDIKEEKIEVA